MFYCFCERIISTATTNDIRYNSELVAFVVIVNLMKYINKVRGIKDAY
jgi:hypothetical protein